MERYQFNADHAAEKPPARVRDLMTADPLCVSPNTPVDEARALLQQHHIQHLPVLENARLVGMVSDSDIRLVLPSPATSLAVYEIRYLLARLTVAEIMTPFPITVGPDRSAIEAGKRLLTYDIGALPVIEHGKVIGILTRTDLLRALLLSPAVLPVAA